MMQDILYQLGSVIEEIRNALKDKHVCDGESIEALSLRIYSQLVRRAYEIFLLLKEDCSLGALSLMRGLYEGGIIMSYIALNKDNNELARRYFIASEVQTYKMLEERKQFYYTHNGSNEGKEQYQKMEAQLEARITQLFDLPKEMWKKHLKNDFWWANSDKTKGKCESIKDLYKRMGFEDDFMYHYFCNLCHFNTYSTMANEDEEGRLIIGSWDGRTAEAIRYTCWYLCLGTDGFCKVFDSPPIKKCISALQIIEEQIKDVID